MDALHAREVVETVVEGGGSIAREVVETVVEGGGSISRVEVETMVEGGGSMLCDTWEYDHRVVFPTITSQVLNCNLNHIFF